MMLPLFGCTDFSQMTPSLLLPSLHSLSSLSSLSVFSSLFHAYSSLPTLSTLILPQVLPWAVYSWKKVFHNPAWFNILTPASWGMLLGDSSSQRLFGLLPHWNLLSAESYGDLPLQKKPLVRKWCSISFWSSAELIILLKSIELRARLMRLRVHLLTFSHQRQPPDLNVGGRGMTLYPNFSPGQWGHPRQEWCIILHNSRT